MPILPLDVCKQTAGAFNSSVPPIQCHFPVTCKGILRAELVSSLLGLLCFTLPIICSAKHQRRAAQYRELISSGATAQPLASALAGQRRLVLPVQTQQQLREKRGKRFRVHAVLFRKEVSPPHLLLLCPSSCSCKPKLHFPPRDVLAKFLLCGHRTRFYQMQLQTKTTAAVTLPR